ASCLQSLWLNDRFWLDRWTVVGGISHSGQFVPAWVAPDLSNQSADWNPDDHQRFVLAVGVARRGGPESGSGRRWDPDRWTCSLFISVHGGTGTRMAALGLDLSAGLVACLMGILGFRMPA